jgi:hypothetical protein
MTTPNTTRSDDIFAATVKQLNRHDTRKRASRLLL